MPKTALRKKPSEDAQFSVLRGKTETKNTSPLNFKVPAEFRREFKTYAAQHNMKLNQLLFEAFAALKEKDAADM